MIYAYCAHDMANKNKKPTLHPAVECNENKVRKNVSLSEETLSHLEELRKLERRNSISNMIEGLVDRAWNSQNPKAA